jgi:UrcA family protein
MKNTALLTAFCALVSVNTLIPTPVFAQDEESVVTAPRSDLRTRHVSYDDLNLATEKGIDRLRLRVRHAAQDVCDADGSALTQFYHARKCIRGAIAGAEPQIARVMERYSGQNVAAMASSTIVIAANR